MAAKPKMLTCTCGNTELDRISVRVQLSNDPKGESLALMALRCGGNGCGRVTFRPDETAKTEIQLEKPAEPVAAPAQNQTPKTIAALFERVYKERLVYKVIAERDPNCPHLVEALKSNPQVCAGITSAFGQVYQRIDANEDLLVALQTLPSIPAE
jgi:hypothetical protein